MVTAPIVTLCWQGIITKCDNIIATTLIVIICLVTVLIPVPNVIFWLVTLPNVTLLLAWLPIPMPNVIPFWAGFYIVALASWLTYAFPGSLFINLLCAHIVFERSPDEGWHNLSATPYDSQDGLLEQAARVLATPKQEEISINNWQSFIGTLV